MKTFISVLVLVLAICGSAQVKPTAVLIDEFERRPCDDFKSHLDLLNNRLAENPDAVAYVVIFGEKGDMRANVFYRGMVQGYLRQWKINPNRVRFITTTFAERLNFQTWIVPPGTEPPSVPVVEWSYKMTGAQKPYKFTWLNESDDICPEVDGLALYAEFLKANPRVRGNIVIRDTTSSAIERRSRLVLAELTRKHQIPRKQLRLFFVKERPDGVNQRVEYWLVP